MINYKLPYETYKRVMWTIRDSYRQKQEYEAILEAYPNPFDGQPRGTDKADPTGQKAIKLAEIDALWDVIITALDIVPAEYRKGIMQFILFRVPFPRDAHPDTYKRWKQRYIYSLACMLGFIIRKAAD